MLVSWSFMCRGDKLLQLWIVVLWVVSIYLFVFGIGRGLGEEFYADCDNGDLGWRGRAC